MTILICGEKMTFQKERFTTRVAVYLVLKHEGKILLALRQNTGYADGLYSLVSGHLEDNETIKQSMAREACEEVGIIIDPVDLEIVHVVQHKSNKHYINFYCTCTKWQGTPINCEPDKCSDVSFFPIDNLPPNTLDSVVKALCHINYGSYFSEYGLETKNN